MEEIWKLIENSNGHYFISNLGRMKRTYHEFDNAQNAHVIRDEKIYEHGNFNKQNGYYSYKYRGMNGERMGEYVHRLVAKYFVNNTCPEEYFEVNHIDGDKSNNIYTNLEWTNRKLNMEHASKNNLINKESEKRKRQAAQNGRNGADKTKKQWCKYDRDGNLVAVEKGGYSESVNRLTYKGYTWRSGEELIKKYGKIPEYLEVSHSFNVTDKSRKVYFALYPNQTQQRFEKIEELPITREELWYSFNHQIPDKNGVLWGIRKAEKGEVANTREYSTIKVYACDENDNVIKYFNSLIECLNFLGVQGASALNKAINKHSLYHGYYWKKEW